MRWISDVLTVVWLGSSRPRSPSTVASNGLAKSGSRTSETSVRFPGSTSTRVESRW